MRHTTGQFITHLPTAVERGWFYDYQTFLAAMIALAAAGLAGWIAWRQLDAAKDQIKVARQQLADSKAQADRDRSGRLRAARASLPAALSSICGYAEDVAKSLMVVLPNAEVLHGALVTGINVEQFPVATLPVLERVMEFAEQIEIVERIASILREAQVLDTRVRGMNVRPAEISDMAESCLMQAASIYARAESLFDFARQQSETLAAEPLWDRVFAAYNIFGMHGQRYEQVKERSRQQRDRGEMPGEADERAVY